MFLFPDFPGSLLQGPMLVTFVPQPLPSAGPPLFTVAVRTSRPFAPFMPMSLVNAMVAAAAKRG